MSYYERKALRRYRWMTQRLVTHPSARLISDPTPHVRRRDRFAWWLMTWVAFHVASDDYRRRLRAASSAATLFRAERAGLLKPTPISEFRRRMDERP